MTDIGARIKKRREEMRLSLTELARRADVSKGHLHSLENGDTQSPSVELLYRIAIELDTTIADLMGQSMDIEEATIEELDIPATLLEFARQADLPESDIRMLARIEYRGKRPETMADWQFIYESIRRTIK